VASEWAVITFLLDTLGAVRPVTARRMFGGVGFYAEGLFFAIATDDLLYFPRRRCQPRILRERVMQLLSKGPGTKSIELLHGAGAPI